MAPVIITQPYGFSVKQGPPLFSVVSAGDPPLTYFWKKSGLTLGGRNGHDLDVTNVQGGSAGTYSVVVSNTAGTTTSFPATLSVSTSNYPVMFYDNFDTDSSTNWNFYWGTQGAPAGLHDQLGLQLRRGSLHLQRRHVSDSARAQFHERHHPRRQIHRRPYERLFNAALNIFSQGAVFSATISPSSSTCGSIIRVAPWEAAPRHDPVSIYGLDFTGTEVNWGTTNGPSDGIWFANDGDGGAVRDYRSTSGPGRGAPDRN